jgi:hypothetical protein
VCTPTAHDEARRPTYVCVYLVRQRAGELPQQQMGQHGKRPSLTNTRTHGTVQLCVWWVGGRACSVVDDMAVVMGDFLHFMLDFHECSDV